MDTDAKEKIEYIGPFTQIPGNLRDQWGGGEFGCPAYDKEKNLVGYVAFMPHDEVDFKACLKTLMEVQK